MTKHLYLTAITGPDVNNGPGIRLTLWFQGCNHKCPGCHNPHTHPYADESSQSRMRTKFIQVCNDNNELNPELVEILSKKLSATNPDGSFVYTGITLSGGDPLQQSETAINELYILLSYIYKERLDLSVWAYTGYTFEELQSIDYIYKFLKDSCINVLIDGRFIQRLRPTDGDEIAKLKWRGSTNQRIIDLHKSLIADEPVVLTDEYV